MRKMGIKASILMPILTVLVIGILIMASMIATISWNTTSNLSERLVSARVNEYANEFKSLCMDSYGTASSLAPVIRQVTEISEDPRQDVTSILANILMADENMLGIWTCWEANAFDGRDSEYAGTQGHDATGRFVPYICKQGSSYQVEPLVDYDHPVDGLYYLGARDSGKPYITDPYTYPVGGQAIPIYTISVPITKNGKTVGAVGIDIRLDDVINTMNAGSILDDGYLFTLSPAGVFATHKNSELLLQNYSAATLLQNYSTQINSILQNGGSFSAEAYSDQAGADVMFLTKSVMIADTGRYWAVCGLVPLKTVNSSSMALTLLSFLIGGALIVVTVLVILFVVRRRLRALPVLTATAEAMSLGDVHAAAFDTGTENTKNEIVLLERAFMKMVAGIKQQAEILGLVANGDFSVTIPVRSEQDVMNQAINTMIAKNNGAMHEIAATASQVASGAEQISQASQNLAAGSSQQAATIQEFSATLSEIQTMADQNSEISTLAQKQMQEVGTVVDECAGDVSQMLSAMREINTSSQDISKVIKVIDDIAFQTNILALNASVEAARASQHGKGFSVVADEVRNLASKSAEAAKETSALIDKSIQNVSGGNTIMEKVTGSIHSVSEIAKQSAGSVGNIYTSSRRQSEVMLEVTSGIGQLSSVVQANAATAEQTAASSEEMSAQSAALDGIVSRFKLKDAGTPASPRQTYVDTGFSLSAAFSDSGDKY